MPFMDHELAAYVSSLPDEYRVRGRTTKWILREAMKQLLPQAILERPKVGFRVPVNEWFPAHEGLSVRAPDGRRVAHAPLLPCVLSQQVLVLMTYGRAKPREAAVELAHPEIWHRQYL